METEVHPDDFFLILSKVLYELPDILDGMIFTYEISHSLRSDFPVWMEKFIDEIDEDEGVFHDSERE